MTFTDRERLSHPPQSPRTCSPFDGLDHCQATLWWRCSDPTDRSPLPFIIPASNCRSLSHSVACCLFSKVCSIQNSSCSTPSASWVPLRQLRGTVQIALHCLSLLIQIFFSRSIFASPFGSQASPIHTILRASSIFALCSWGQGRPFSTIGGACFSLLGAASTA